MSSGIIYAVHKEALYCRFDFTWSVCASAGSRLGCWRTCRCVTCHASGSGSAVRLKMGVITVSLHYLQLLQAITHMLKILYLYHFILAQLTPELQAIHFITCITTLLYEFLGNLKKQIIYKLEVYMLHIIPCMNIIIIIIEIIISDTFIVLLNSLVETAIQLLLSN